jgi:hypothetical protein
MGVVLGLQDYGKTVRTWMVTAKRVLRKVFGPKIQRGTRDGENSVRHQAILESSYRGRHGQDMQHGIKVQTLSDLKLTFRKVRRKSNFANVRMSTHTRMETINGYTRTSESSWNRNSHIGTLIGRSMTVPRPCYRREVLFRHLRFIVLSFSQGQIRHAFQDILIYILFKIAYVGNCVSWNT